MKRMLIVLLLPVILFSSTCRNPVSGEQETVIILWQEDSDGFVQFSTNDSQHKGNSFVSVYGASQDPMGAVSAEVKKISGSLMGSFGLVFCYQDVDDYYLLCIDVQGFYAIYRQASGTWSTMANWAYCDALNKGFGATNTLGVTYHRLESSFSAFINDNPVTTFQDTRFTGGRYGYSVDILSGGYERFPDYPVDVRFRLAATSGITVGPTSGLVTTEGGGTDSFSVVLNSKPSANVTIGLWNSDPTEGLLSASSLVFTPEDWAIAQTVTVTGVDDLVDDENRLYTIVTVAAVSTDSAYDGIDARNVQVSNTDDDPPAAPGNLIATAVSGGQNDLAWNDNSTNEDGFKIERRVGVEGGYAQIASVGAGVKVYSDTAVSRIPGDIYYYRVRTYNAAGDSGYSNEAAAMSKLVAYDNPYGTFGSCVAIGGNYALVGAPGDDGAGSNAGAAYIFQRIGANSWDGGVKLFSPEPEAGAEFGCSVAIDGDYIVVGARNEDEGEMDAGAAYIFHRTGTNAWDAGTKIVAPVAQATNRFGSSLGISGDYAVVAAYGEACIFHRTGENSWDGGIKIVSPNLFEGPGYGRSVSIDGDYAVVGDWSHYEAGFNGAAFIYHRTGPNSWDEYSKVRPSDGQLNDMFGRAVAIRGDYAVIGADEEDERHTDAGAAYIFHRNGTNSWDAGSKLLPDSYGNSFGSTVAIDGDNVVVGAYRDTEGGYYAGAVFFFHRTDINSWDSGTKFYWPSGEYGWLGYSVSIDDGRTIVGYGVYVLY